MTKKIASGEFGGHQPDTDFPAAAFDPVFVRGTMFLFFAAKIYILYRSIFYLLYIVFLVVFFSFFQV
ncbi:hypothetical protein LZ24_02939 [Desulfobotulus alkaliphilus]|uniref:Uncharacterized protein n=1 Tax=Desulfobotulus alkaliphilus TaxID=622671 RepID=A0A562RAF6_9BACT|nr:hypothetical protein [Desulfobotulus alkaliphilus]TWI66028.1 hypothetical protein LZ24_02939 [Desulfobotulus alkaliphilus]